MRSLLSLSFLALVYAHFFDQKVWMRGLLFAGTVPIAIAANAARVTLAGLISDWRPELAQGVFHTLEGWVLFLVAMLLLVVLHRMANRGYALVRRRGHVVT
jgi:exosortase/archaeosortase family protein